MATAVQYLMSSPSKKYRVFDVFGSDTTLRTEVVQEIERRVSARQRVSLSAAESSAEALWRAVAQAPLAGAGSRMVLVSESDRIRDWSGLQRFITDRSAFTETTLVLISDRADPGKRVKKFNPRIPGKIEWVTELTESESLIKEYSSGIFIHCQTPSLEVSGVDGLSAVARWMRLRVGVSQRQAEYLWSRSGQSTALVRDVLDQFKILGTADVSLRGETEFHRLVDSVLTLHGAEDFAELLLFGKRDLAVASLLEHTFSVSEWSRVIGFLSQRLDWLQPLHVALGTNERLDQVEARLKIHRKWILHYAHREDKSHNIARYYDAARVRRCRLLLAELDSVLSSIKYVPPGFGEVLLAAW
jgi:hypothetical protein